MRAVQLAAEHMGQTIVAVEDGEPYRGRLTALEFTYDFQGQLRVRVTLTHKSARAYLHLAPDAQVEVRAEVMA